MITDVADDFQLFKVLWMVEMMIQVDWHDQMTSDTAKSGANGSAKES